MSAFASAEHRASWEAAKATFDAWPQHGTMPCGAPIRRHPEWGDGVREPSGFICSPIAYSVRNYRDKVK